MKTLNVRLSFLFVLLLCSSTMSAQGYKTGIGLRLSQWKSGITIKQFLGSTGAVEGIVAFGSKSLIITALYEKHTAFPTAEGLSWFFGGGGHIGFYDDGYDYYYKRGNNYYVYKDNGSATMGIGADFILGLDYKFKKAPVDLSLDVKPFVDFVDGFQGYWDGALSVRFTL